MEALCADIDALGSLVRVFCAGGKSSEDPDDREDCIVAEALGPRRALRGGRGGGDDFSLAESTAMDVLFVVPKSTPVNVELTVVARSRFRAPGPNVLIAFSALNVGIVGDSEREDVGVLAWTGRLGGTGRA